MEGETVLCPPSRNCQALSRRSRPPMESREVAEQPSSAFEDDTGTRDGTAEFHGDGNRRSVENTREAFAGWVAYCGEWPATAAPAREGTARPGEFGSLGRKVLWSHGETKGFSDTDFRRAAARTGSDCPTMRGPLVVQGFCRAEI